MTISSIDVVIYTVFFLIPGFVTAEVKNTIIPGKRRSEAEKTLVYLGYSVFNFGCWFWAIQLLNNRFINKTPLYWGLLILITLASGFVTGCVLGVIKRLNPINKILNKLKIPIERPIPTAWEYVFSRMKEGKLVTVSLDDGTYVRGAFYNKSFASSDLEKMDIYLEEAYMLNDDEKWIRVKGSEGIWISAGAIKWISLFNEGGITVCQEKKKEELVNTDINR